MSLGTEDCEFCPLESFKPTKLSFRDGLSFGSLALSVSPSPSLSLSAEMLVCREWLRQRVEERKKGGCRVMSATVSPQAF